MTDTYTVSTKTRIFRFLGKPAFRLLFRIISKITITGMENVPKSGAYMVAINHVSLYDPPFVLAFWPQMLEAMGASDLWERPKIRFLVNAYGGLQVHRGEFDRKVLEMALGVLQSGHPLLMAPEGGRTHQPGMRQALPGVAFLLEMEGVPIVPVGVIGTTDDYAAKAFSFKYPSIALNIGKPINLPPVEGKGPERREARLRNADLVMRYIAGLLPENYRGVYAGQEVYQ